MSYQLEFINDPTRVLTHCLERDGADFIRKIGGLPYFKKSVWVVVLAEDEIIAVTSVVQFVFDIAKDVAEKFWTDRGVLVGRNNEDHSSRRKAFYDVCRNYTSEGSSFVLWWVLDDIEVQCDMLGDKAPIKAACDYAERKIIEYAIAQQEPVT